MKFLGIYFTGTGNTKILCDKAADELKARGHDIDVVDVTRGEVADINGYDGLFVFYPIFAFNTPKPMIKYVKKLKKADKVIPCVIMKQSGEHLFWNNASSLHLKSILKRRRIIVRNEYHYLMPYSFIFRHTDYMAYRMKSVMEKLVPLDLDLFFAGKDVKIKRFFLDRFVAFVFRIQWWGGRFNGRFYKVEKEKCVMCLKCVNDCTSKNISVKDGKIVFGRKCLMCQRCVMYCPKKAIKAGMFNAWRVDEPYTFKEAEYQPEVKPNYCKKNYQKYFEQSEKRILERK